MDETSEPTRFAPEDASLLAAIVLLPWAFGGVEQWAFRSAALLLVVGASVALWRRGWAGWGLGPGREATWLVPAFLLAVWAGVQLIPLPPSVLSVLSPKAHEIYKDALPGYGAGDPGAGAIATFEERALLLVPEATGRPPEGPEVNLVAPSCFDGRWRSLSLQPTATVERLLWYLALLLGFLVVRERTSNAEVRGIYRWTLFALFMALALFALVQAQTWNGKIYWLRGLTAKDKVAFGPYVNPTNLAGVMELATPWLAGYAFGRLRRFGTAALHQGRFTAAVLGVGIGVVATFSSASKAGVGLVAGGLFCVTLMAIAGWKGRAVLAVAALVVASASPLLLSETRLGQRFEEYTTRVSGAEVGEGRVSVLRAGLAMARDYPLTGTGFGAFREVFPSYMPAGATRWWDQAHNDYLELVTDGGILAGLLVLWLAWGYSRRVWRRLGSSSGGAFLSRAGLAIGVLSLAVHATLDFNHQIPANALLFVACCGLLLPTGNQAAQDSMEDA